MDNLKMRFLKAVLAGELGSNDKQGITVTSKEFISYFNDIHPGYVKKFLPAATIEKGRTEASYTQYIFRVRRGVYRLHSQAIDVYAQLCTNEKLQN